MLSECSLVCLGSCDPLLPQLASHGITGMFHVSQQLLSIGLRTRMGSEFDF